MLSSALLPPMSMLACAVSCAVLLPVVIVSWTPLTSTRIVPLDWTRTAATWTHAPLVTVVVDWIVLLTVPNANLPLRTDVPKSAAEPARSAVEAEQPGASVPGGPHVGWRRTSPAAGE